MTKQNSQWKSRFWQKATHGPRLARSWKKSFPKRLERVKQQFRRLPGQDTQRLWWPAEPLVLLLDLLGIGEWYEWTCNWLKYQSRPLTPRERSLAYPIFKDSIDYERVRIDERAFLGPPQLRICYVSFYHINSWGAMSDSTLIHELVHVWQYQHWGSVYLVRALHAQHAGAGYDYGGVEGLELARKQGKQLRDFNPEQQADIVADFFRLSRRQMPRWGRAGPEHLELYRHFAAQICG